MKIIFKNGFIVDQNNNIREEFLSCKDPLIEAINEGKPFRGNDEQMAFEAYKYIAKKVPDISLSFGTIYEHEGGHDHDGIFTDYVLFQCVTD